MPGLGLFWVGFGSGPELFGLGPAFWVHIGTYCVTTFDTIITVTRSKNVLRFILTSLSPGPMLIVLIVFSNCVRFYCNKSSTSSQAHCSEYARIL